MIKTSYLTELFLPIEFDNLLKELKLPEDICKLHIGDSVSYFYDRYNEDYKDNCDTINSMMQVMLNDITYSQSIMCLKYNSRPDEDKTRFTIYAPTEGIFEMFCNIYERDPNTHKNTNYIPTDEEIKEYFKLMLRHEIGHVIDRKQVIEELGKTKAIEFFDKQNETDFKKYYLYMDSIDDIDNDLEYYSKSCHAYYDMEVERKANEATNVDVERLIELELKVRIGINAQH